MPTAVNGDIEICYQTFGDEQAPPLMLVMGLGAQMTAWPDDWCSALAGAGRFVIRFDNRGRSSIPNGSAPSRRSCRPRASAPSTNGIRRFALGS